MTKKPEDKKGGKEGVKDREKATPPRNKLPKERVGTGDNERRIFV